MKRILYNSLIEWKNFDAFKLFALDVGLLGAMASAPASLMLTSNDVFKEFKGAFSENYVLEQLERIIIKELGE